jgi:alkanesulfonate monooxygenase SsuD/methylene tetrahydromethanopterin reductase-like flavin-dependent oxidoreductase (luciferase family)
MEIGIGLPTTIPDVEAEQVIDWSREADAAGFSSLATLDRIVYPNYEPLIALGAAAAVTQRITLLTGILITPYRTNTALLAKEAATLQHLSGGRLRLGVGIGARGDDYTASGLATNHRGRVLDGQLEEMQRIWAGEERGTAGAIGPALPGGPPELIIGGKVDAAFERAARWGAGWISGAGGAAVFGESVGRLRAAWEGAGREGSPRAIGFAYYALGEGAREQADRYLRHYYAFAGGYADQLAAASPVDAEAVVRFRDTFAAAGCDELLFFPCSSDPAQVGLLAEAVLQASEPSRLTPPETANSVDPTCRSDTSLPE